MFLSYMTTILYVCIVMLILLFIYLLFLLILVIGIDKHYLNIRLGDNIIKPIDYDFYKDLVKEDFSFYSKKNKLQGGKYYYNNFKDSKKIAIVVHGYKANHKNYFAEINFLASIGYLVYAYDGTGTSLSGGKKFGGAPQAIIDLECAINEVKRLNKDSTILLFGHSMGAYAVCNVINVVNVDKVIAVAPFDNMPDVIVNSVREKLGQNFFLLKTMYKFVQYLKFKKYSKFRTYSTLSKTDTKVLVIHGINDKTVPVEPFLESFNNNTNPNISYLLEEDKFHRPLQSINASSYYQYLLLQRDGLLVKTKNKPTNKEIDDFNQKINREIMNELDQNVLEKIKSFLEEK